MTQFNPYGTTAPTFSIITAVLNGADTIQTCLESVGAQPVAKEHIVIDGASKDGTLTILRKFQARHPHVRILSERDGGLYEAMNKGLKWANGDIIGFLNADDIYQDPHVLQRVKRTLRIHGTDSCYGDLVYVAFSDLDKAIRWWKSGPFRREQFLWGWMPPHPTFLVRREIYDKYGWFNTDLGSAADYELMLRFLYKKRITSTYVPQVLVRMRSGGLSNASLKNRFTANRMDRKAWRINGLRPFFWTLYFKPLRKLSQYIALGPRYRIQ